MNRKIALTLLIATALTLAGPVPAQSTPSEISIQGYLTHQGGTPVSGTVSMIFSLWDAALGGMPLTALPPQNVMVSEGIYQAEVAFDRSLFAQHSNLYIQVEVDGETQTPRIHVVSAPFAFQADKLDGLDGDEFIKKAGDTMTGPLTVEGPIHVNGGLEFPDETVLNSASGGAVSLDQAYDQGSTITADTGPVHIAGLDGLAVDGNVGIGTTTPLTRFHLKDGASGGTPYQGGARLTVESNASSHINLLSPSAHPTGLYFGNEVNNIEGGIHYNDGAAPKGLLFRTNGNITRMTIRDNGHVGIGTTTPSNRLSVSGNADLTGNLGIGTSTPSNRLSVSGNADLTGNLGIGTSTPSNRLSVSGNADLTGNLGIGTSTPSNRLSVNGNADLTGNLGIGTTTPIGPLDIRSADPNWPVWISGANPGIQLSRTGAASSWAIYHQSDDALSFRDSSTAANRMTISGSSGDVNIPGNLGIGATAPSNKLSVNGNADLTGNLGIGTSTPESALTVRGLIPAVPSQQGVHAGRITFDANQDTGLYIVGASGGGAQLRFYELNNQIGRLWLQPGTSTLRFDGADMVSAPTLEVRDNLGIGTEAPESALSVTGLMPGTPTQLGIHMGRITGFEEQYGITINAQTHGAIHFLQNGNHMGRIRAIAGSDSLMVDRVSQFSVPVLEIRGGADIVEGFETSDDRPVAPGTVMVIDPDNVGALKTSTEAYDYKVAGVVSGARGIKPGIHLGQKSVLDGDTKVAMTGRVYVKCSTENGSIRPGDRLTTAWLAGHAMKATDPMRSDGAVIGKAMSSLDEETGMVLVLVNLQ